MRKAARLLTILNLLRTRRSLSVAQLSAELEVSERTVYRDIVTLSEAGAPVYYDRGYKLLPGTFLPPLNLTSDEYATLKVALTATPLAQTQAPDSDLRSVLNKIDIAVNSFIPEELKKQESRRQVILKSTAGERAGSYWLRQLRRAVDGDLVIEFSYLSLKGEQSRRAADPYFLIFRGRAYYLIAYCQRRKEMRLFRLDRISDLKIRTQRFARNPEVSPASFFQHSWELQQGQPVRVKLQLSGRAAIVAQSGQHHPSEKLRQLPDGRLEYVATVAGLDEIARWVLGFGGEAVVVAPAELKQMVLARAETICEKHRAGR